MGSDQETLSDASPVGKARQQRTTFSLEQIQHLEEFFTKIQYPDKRELATLSEKTTISSKKIQVRTNTA